MVGQKFQVHHFKGLGGDKKINKSTEHLSFWFQFRVEQVKDVSKILVEQENLDVW